MKNALIALITVLLVSCASLLPGQNVQLTSELRPGMQYDDVVRIMGEPEKVEFSGNVTALHYCRTGMGADEFALILLENDVVHTAKNYTVTLADAGGATGHCRKFIRSAF